MYVTVCRQNFAPQNERVRNIDLLSDQNRDTLDYASLMRPNSVLGCTFTVWMIFATGAAPATLRSMRWQRRVVLVAAPSPADPNVVVQRHTLTDWAQEAAARDVSVVEVAGSGVVGASDTSASLRRRYHLVPGAFQVLLIGKDGHVALRSARPVDAATLRDAIDAMPMRRAGER